MNFFRVLIFLVLLAYCTAKITFANDIAGKQIKDSDILASPYILVEAEHRELPIQNAKTFYCKLTIRDKNKRAGYSMFIRTYRKIVQNLINYSMIPGDQMMVHSKIQIKFHASRKKWQFARHFILIAPNKHVNTVTYTLKKYHAEQLKQSPKIRYLTQKYQALEAFNIAKMELQAYLQKIKGGKALTILSTEDIEVIGPKAHNYEKIQSQLQFQTNHSKGQMTTVKYSKDGKQFINKKREYDSKLMIVKVLFKVGIQNKKQKYTEGSDDISISNIEDQNDISSDGYEDFEDKQLGESISMTNYNDEEF